MTVFVQRARVDGVRGSISFLSHLVILVYHMILVDNYLRVSPPSQTKTLPPTYTVLWLSSTAFITHTPYSRFTTSILEPEDCIGEPGGCRKRVDQNGELLSGRNFGGYSQPCHVGLARFSALSLTRKTSEWLSKVLTQIIVENLRDKLSIDSIDQLDRLTTLDEPNIARRETTAVAMSARPELKVIQMHFRICESSCLIRSMTKSAS